MSLEYGRPTEFDALRLLKPKSAADYLGLTENTLAKWRMRGCGPDYMKFGTAIRYDSTHLQEYAAGQVRHSTSDEGAR
jgi:Helix-turn-helix domain